MYVGCSTVYNSKDLRPTQMPINNRLDEENVAHMHHEILCSHKSMSSCLLKVMDEAGNHHSQQTDTRTENQKPHVLTHKCMLNNENTWTQEGEHHTPGPIGGWELGRDSMGRNSKCGRGGGMQQNTLPCVYLCKYFARSAHVPQNLKCNLKK